MDYKRCPWANTLLEMSYHDKVWGKQKHDEHTLFEFIILEIMQAGLSWKTILAKREAMGEALDNFDFNIIKDYDHNKINSLMDDPRVVRNKLKLESLKHNAIAFLDISYKFGSFDNYIWSYTNHKTILNTYERVQDVPSKTNLSEQITKDMKEYGFKFIGSTIIYSYMQSTGVVNDHMLWCDFYNNYKDSTHLKK